jgi:hypothetical protein
MKIQEVVKKVYHDQSLTRTQKKEMIKGEGGVVF